MAKVKITYTIRMHNGMGWGDVYNDFFKPDSGEKVFDNTLAVGDCFKEGFTGYQIGLQL
jgi:hypothetical protein